MIIEDGTGTGKKLKVDNNNDLRTHSKTEPEAHHAAEVGDKFNINTGDVTLTDATATSVLYIKNNEDSDLIVTSLIYNLGASTGGSGDVRIDVYRNPTAGTIIDTTPTNVDYGTGVEGNQNFGSNKILSVSAYKGTTADDNFTDGSISVSTRSASITGRLVVDLGAVVIPKGSSLGITYTPPTSNTSQVCQFAAACYLKTPAVSGN
jgi:hypothetical protein